MPDIRPRRKSVPLVSELVRNQLSINLAVQLRRVRAYMFMYTYTEQGDVDTTCIRVVRIIHIRENEQAGGDDALTLVHRRPRC